nr:MAG TPA: hypothetical protein [Caudoviricetes sp.]DAZ38259.1 MAG TPA: hypothetical protein [Caudoviricetes sp.]
MSLSYRMWILLISDMSSKITLNGIDIRSNTFLCL